MVSRIVPEIPASSCCAQSSKVLTNVSWDVRGMEGGAGVGGDRPTLLLYRCLHKLLSLEL